mmetsp:Transcript_364/g.683  ORF Transcript_364/g.683 Transcript_364/m.683 type:complete len:81 (+) Transcript_364:17-259(+)
MGPLKVQVLEGVFERDTSTFLSMNPKYIINWKEEKIEGTAAYDGGKNPKWENEHEIDIEDDPEGAGIVTITFLDDEDLIC